MKVWITGHKGKLAGSLATALDAANLENVTPAEDEIDITDYPALQTAMAEAAPDVVINAAAWTDVDGCSREPERALHINAYGAQNVALAAYTIGAAVVQISSNEVFDGQHSQPYQEYDATGAVNPYGRSKLHGERAVAAVNPRHMIVRTAWLFAHSGKNFLHAILNAAFAGKPLKVVTDEVANPTYNDDLADALVRLIKTGRYGTYHLTNAGACSRYTFARYALDQAGYASTPIQPITRHEWPRASTPPVYAALANTFAGAVGVTLRPWQEAVTAFLEREERLA
jgi:dTDP-4-dehydrorhamnose reductase